MFNFVAMQIGSSIVPECLRALSRPDIVFKPIRPPNLSKTLVMVKRKNDNGLAASFYRFTLDNLERIDSKGYSFKTGRNRTGRRTKTAR